QLHDVVALCELRGRGMPAIVREVEDTELFDWEEVANVAAQRERMKECVCWRARRSRGLCWRGVC
ncbi:elongation factor 1-gamma (EF-1-gamma), putative, partial [Trypanosoma cruzi]